MSKTKMAVLRWVGYVVFFVVALLLFVRFTFPTDQLRELIESQLADKLAAERVEIADLGLSGLLPSGVTLEGLEIDLPPVMVKTPDRGVDVQGPVRSLAAEELALSGSVFGFMGGSIDAELEGKIQGGTITGAKVAFEKGSPLEVEVESIAGVELGTEGLFLTLTGFDIIATLGGKLKVAVPMGEADGPMRPQLDQLSGEVELELADAKVLQPIIDTVMNREPVRLAFTDTDLGTITLKVKTSEAAATSAVSTGAAADAKGARRALVIDIEELSAVGGHVQLAVAPKATLTLQPGMGIKDANINAHLVVKIEDPWFEIEVKDRNDPTKTTKPNIGVRTMISMGALKAFVQDGQFGIALIGPLGKLKPRLERPRTRIGSPGLSGGRKVKVDHPSDEPEEGEDDSGAAPQPPPAAVTAPEPAKARALPSANDRAGPTPVVRTPGGVSRAKPGGRFDRPRPRIVTDQLTTPEPPEEPPAVEEPEPEPTHEEPEPAPEEGGGEMIDEGAPVEEGGEPLAPEEPIGDEGHEGDF